MTAAVSPSTGLTPTLVGALLGLVAALILQIVIIPLVQRAGRRRERWETAVSELRAVAEVEMPQAIHEFVTASVSHQYAIGELSRVQIAQTDQGRRFISDKETARQSAKRAMFAKLARIIELSDGVADGFGRILAHAQRQRLFELVRDLSRQVVLVTHEMDSPPTGAPRDRCQESDALRIELREREQSATNVCTDLYRYVKPIAMARRPPRPLRDAARARLAGVTMRTLTPVVWTHAKLIKISAARSEN